MRAELHLAARYLVGIGRRTHVATVTLISFLGLALGVLALVVVLALIEGFQSAIRSGLVATTVHARVEPKAGRRLSDARELASVLQGQLPGVDAVLVVRGTCLVASEVDAVPASVIGRSDVSEPAVNRVLAVRLAIAPGDEVEVISARQRLTPMGPVPVRARVEVGATGAVSQGEEGGTLRLPLEVAQRILWGGDVVESIELSAAGDPWGVGRRTRALLAEIRPDVRVAGLDEIHRPLLLALTLERVMIFAAVALILVVAALNLVCNIAMVAAEKRKDLAVLASLGLEPARLRRLFVVMGLGIGLAAAAVGSVSGVVLATLLDATGALRLPRGVFVATSVPFRVSPVTVAAVVGLALALAATASWLPARVVARREPAEGLRYE